MKDAEYLVAQVLGYTAIAIMLFAAVGIARNIVEYLL